MSEDLSSSSEQPPKESQIGADPLLDELIHCDPWPLHRAVLLDDEFSLLKLATTQRLWKETHPEDIPFHPHLDINARDCRGNPALHLAIHLRRQRLISILLENGADVSFKNGSGWSCLQEAIASSDPEVVSKILRGSTNFFKQTYEQRIPKLLQSIRELPDFELDLRWEVTSWVPLVSHLCPWDDCKIYKKGSSVRIDTTLIGFDNLSWKRGHLSFILLPEDSEFPGKLLMLNHEHKLEEDGGAKKMELVIESFNKHSNQNESVKDMLTANLVRMHFDISNVVFTRGKNFFGYEKTEKIGLWESCKLFHLSNINRISKKRTDQRYQQRHLKKHDPRPPQTDSDLQKAIKKYASPTSIKKYFSVPEPNVSSRKGPTLLYDYETEKVSTKEHTGKIWLSPSFPIALSDLTPIFEVLSPTGKHFEKLHSFISLKMPEEGFPVKLEFPVLPTITATVQFGQFSECPLLDPLLFQPPEDYHLLQEKSMMFATKEKSKK